MEENEIVEPGEGVKYIDALLMQSQAIAHLLICPRKDVLDCVECSSKVSVSMAYLQNALGNQNILEGFKSHGCTVRE